MSVPLPPDVHHLHWSAVACLACQRDRRDFAGDRPPAWCYRCDEPRSWAEAERSIRVPEWQGTRLRLGWTS